MSRKEIEDSLLNAQSSDEVSEILAGAGVQLSDESAKDMFAKIRLLSKTDGAALSENELTTVSGGRDYLTEGCAATVEPGSDCWETDGGCSTLNNTYEHAPTAHTCYVCGSYMYILRDPGKDEQMVYYRCTKCRNETWGFRPGQE